MVIISRYVESVISIESLGLPLSKDSNEQNLALYHLLNSGSNVTKLPLLYLQLDIQRFSYV